MSGELIEIVAVGVTLAGLILTSNRGLREDMARLLGTDFGHFQVASRADQDGPETNAIPLSSGS